MVLSSGFVLLVLLASSVFSQCVYYVKPNDSISSCPGQSCHTIDQYASQGDKYFTTGASFLFLPGNHSLNTTLHLHDISDMIFEKEETISLVVIKIAKPLILKNATNVTIQGLTFMLSADKSPGNLSALGVFDSKEIFLRNLSFLGASSTTARAANISHSDVGIINCLFVENTGYYGGAIYASNGASITLDGNAFIQNKAAIFGGAIFANDSSLVLKETFGNTFTCNSAELDGGAIYCLHSMIAIVGTNESTTGPFVAGEMCTEIQAQKDRKRVDSHVTYFSYNEARSKFRDGGGGAIYIGESVASLSGTVIILHNNSASTSGGALNSYVSVVTSYTKCLCFHGNGARHGGAYYGTNSTLNLGSYSANMQEWMHGESIEIFAHNRAIKGGGALSSIGSNTTFSGMAVRFVSNSARNGGGVYIGDASRLVIAVEKLIFESNVAFYSGGGLLVFSSEVEVDKTYCILSSSNRTVSINFTNNTAFNGGGLAVLQSNLNFSGHLTFFKNVGSGIGATGPSIISFTGNTVFEENRATLGVVGGGAIKISMKTSLFISGVTLFINNTADNGGAIFASNSNSVFSNTSTFVSNSAGNSGGAMYFEYGAKMSLKINTTLATSYNHASKYGGAIYHRDTVMSTQCKFVYSEWRRNEDVTNLPGCFLILLQLDMDCAPYAISSYEDSAGTDGNFLYGGLTDRCQLTADDVYGYHPTVLYPILLRLKVLNITSKNTSQSTAINITSKPFELCFCESSQMYNCTQSISKQTFRGQKFILNLLALVQGNTTVTSPQSIRAKLSGTARIKPYQMQQNLQPNCAGISYNLYSAKDKEKLVLYLDGSLCLDSGAARAILNLTILPCPDGFSLSHDECICETRLQAYKADCNIHDDGGIYIATRAGSKFWVNASYSNGTYQGLILYPRCPTWYCKTEPVNISLSTPDVQCDHNHSGVLCGACALNFSLMLGSSGCEVCSNTYLILLLPFAAGGIVLVVFISVLRLTVATGMINSILLYANILQANRNLLYPHSTSTNVLTVHVHSLDEPRPRLPYLLL
jgi:predicted outer membrane repeat protein